MVASWWLSWQADVSLSASDGQAVVAGSSARVVLRPLAPEIIAALERLTPPGEEEERLSESILAAGSVDSLARWHYHVNQLRQRGLIRRTLYADGRPLATFSPLCRTPKSSTRPGSIAPGSIAPGSNPPVSKHGALTANTQRHDGNGAHGSESVVATAFVLSRFACIRREGDTLIVESPLAHARVILEDPRVMPILGALAAPATMSQLTADSGDLAPADIQAFLSLLQEAKMVDQVMADPASGRQSSGLQDDAALATWEFHDLLFHSRSRRGRSGGRFGGTYRFADRPPPPALKPPADRKGIDLYRPDPAQLERDDPPLALVQQRRRSIRSYGKVPVTARELGEFLFRVGRVTKHNEFEAQTPSGPIKMDFTSRPYPAGGGLYELEFYAAVRACTDLEAGLYHYDPEQHRLESLSGPNGDCGSLLEDAALSAGIAADSLQVLVILTARFARLAWKYESIAYSLILKDVGVVLQTMYLAATAMNLAPCALGCGDSDLFARAAETDYFAETSVGEFLLGSIDVLT